MKDSGCDDSQQQYIETIPKRGYRFVPGVSRLLDESTGISESKSETSRVIPTRRETNGETHTGPIVKRNGMSSSWVERVVAGRFRMPDDRPALLAVLTIVLYTECYQRAKTTSPFQSSNQWPCSLSALNRRARMNTWVMHDDA